MAKINKIVQAQSDQVAFRHQETYDDTLLPDAQELARLKEVDPSIIPWVLEKTSLELDRNHSYADRKFSLLETEQKVYYKITISTIGTAFLLLATGMLLSFALLQSGQNITGTIFGGSTLLFAAKAFLSFKRNP